MSAPPPRPARPVWRHALEGALATASSLVTMAATAWAALALLGADAVAPVSRLIPALVSTAVGGGVTLESAAGPTGTAGAGGLGALFGGGGLSIGLAGEATLTPLTLTFLGTAVLAVAFFRPLRRRERPTPAMLWARCGGALATAAVALPVCAVLARGTARLPEGVKDRIGERAGSGRLGGLGGDGLTSGLSSATFRADATATVLLGLLGVVAVLALGCLAARRTTLPRPLALGRPRMKWNAVLSTLTGAAAVLCCAALTVAALTGAAALTGRERAAEAAGVLLLAAPNLITVLLTAGTGTWWEAGVERLRPAAGAMPGAFGGGGQGDTAGQDRSVNLGDWGIAGIPLWVVALLLVMVLLLLVGYVAAVRTPARTPRENADALLDRHTDTALRTGIAVALVTFVLPFLARGSLRVGISLMDNEMGGLRAGLDTSPRLSALTAFTMAALAAYGGSRLHGRRARRRRERPAGKPDAASRRRTSTSDPVS